MSGAHKICTIDERKNSTQSTNVITAAYDQTQCCSSMAVEAFWEPQLV